MENQEKYNQEIIASFLHDKIDDSSTDLDAIKQTIAFRESEKIFRARKKIAFLTNLHSEEESWNNFKSIILKKSWKAEVLKYAAIIVLSFSVGILLMYFANVHSNNTELASITSPRGQITSLTLFDGSIVWLNSESTIKYASNFNRRKREVYVEGEAYFEVVKNTKRPFIVNIGKSQVKVHGTKFNVKAYPTDQYVETVLIEGKVEFIDNNRSLFLEPNQRIALSKETGRIEKGLVDTKETMAWKEGKVYFNNQSLSLIIQQLERWYELEFHFNESEIANYHFTGVINREKSIEYNLKIIQLTNKIDFKFSEGKVVINKAK